MNRTAKPEALSAIAMVSAVVVAIAVMHAAMPAIFSRTQTDRVRTGVLLRALRDAPASLQLVVLGNSTVMNGIDTARLAPALPSGATAWNLSSTGQTLGESYLYHQELPESVRHVVVVITPHNLVGPRPIPDSVYNSFYLYGYRPAPATRSRLEPVESLSAGIARPDFFQRARGRWAVRQTIDTAARSMLRRDLTITRAVHDLSFPQAYTQPVRPEKLERLLAGFARRNNVTSFVPHPDTTELLLSWADQAQAGNTRFTLVIAPVHPRLREQMDSDYLNYLEAFLQRLGDQGIQSANFHDLLTAGEFIDVVHPTTGGAHRLSDQVADLLR